MSWIVCSVGVSVSDEDDLVAEEAAATVSGKGSAGLSILPLGFRGMRVRGTKTARAEGVSSASGRLQQRKQDIPLGTLYDGSLVLRYSRMSLMSLRYRLRPLATSVAVSLPPGAGSAISSSSPETSPSSSLLPTRGTK